VMTSTLGVMISFSCIPLLLLSLNVSETWSPHHELSGLANCSAMAMRCAYPALSSTESSTLGSVDVSARERMRLSPSCPRAAPVSMRRAVGARPGLPFAYRYRNFRTKAGVPASRLEDQSSETCDHAKSTSSQNVRTLRKGFRILRTSMVFYSLRMKEPSYFERQRGRRP
jgi:hypothetical protein